ncbi:MAG: carbohydrate ABC transporter permease [bacterium]
MNRATKVDRVVHGSDATPLTVQAVKEMREMKEVGSPAPQESNRSVNWLRARRTLGLLGRAAGYGILAAGGVLMILPVVWMVSSSMKQPADIFTIPVQWWPNPIRVKNYVDAMSLAPFARYFFNSIFVGVSVTLLNVFFSTLAGFGFAKYEFWGREVLFIAILSTLMIPFQVVMVPLYIIVRRLGWIDTYASLIIPGAISAFGVFMMRQFIMTIPNELLDAARIDGVSEFGIFCRIIVPLCRGPMVALAIFTFLSSWNNLLWPLIAVSRVELRTVALGLAEFQTVRGTAYHHLMAAATVATIPLLILFATLQRHFIRGVVLSGLKG